MTTQANITITNRYTTRNGRHGVRYTINGAKAATFIPTRLAWATEADVLEHLCSSLSVGWAEDTARADAASHAAAFVKKAAASEHLQDGRNYTRITARASHGDDLVMIYARGGMLVGFAKFDADGFAGYEAKSIPASLLVGRTAQCHIAGRKFVEAVAAA